MEVIGTPDFNYLSEYFWQYSVYFDQTWGYYVKTNQTVLFSFM